MKFKTKEEIKTWLDKYEIKNYTISDDLTVEVNGGVDLSNKSLKEIPFKFKKINGFFDCSYNNQKIHLFF